MLSVLLLLVCKLVAAAGPIVSFMVDHLKASTPSPACKPQDLLSQGTRLRERFENEEPNNVVLFFDRKTVSGRWLQALDLFRGYPARDLRMMRNCHPSCLGASPTDSCFSLAFSPFHSFLLSLSVCVCVYMYIYIYICICICISQPIHNSPEP